LPTVERRRESALLIFIEGKTMRNYNKACKSVGELVLKNGARNEVTWEVNLEEGAVVRGVLRGNKRHLKTAAKHGCAILSLGEGRTADIAIDRYRDGKLFFTSLLTSTVTTSSGRIVQKLRWGFDRNERCVAIAFDNDPPCFYHRMQLAI
jgi:hypothetical protein